MAINKVNALYFSPTGTTAMAAIAFAEGMGVPAEKIDLTLPEFRQAFNRSFGEDEVIVAGLPVYGGRLPKNLDDFFTGLKGNGASAVALVMYGNREYDDAIVELRMRLEEQSFAVKAGAAFIGEHTFSKNIASGRPDKNDLAIAADFGKQAAALISAEVPGTLNLNGNFPFKMKGFDPAVPGPSPASAIRITTTELCTRCGLCAENCPWGVIDRGNPGTINYSGCMRCLRCVRICPAAAKCIDDKLMSFVPQFEARLNAQRKEPELLLMH